MEKAKRDLLSVQDLSEEEISFILERASSFKRQRSEGILSEDLRGKIIALLFESPSTRTRVSFEAGIYELGGSPIFLSAQELQLSRGETMADTARALSRYVHAVVARLTSHDRLVELAKHSSVPVINALSPLEHPCQALADLLTIREHKGGFRGLKVAWVGDGNNVCNSLMLGCSLMGADFCAACPPGYEPPPEILKQASENARGSGAKVEVLEDPREAVTGADIVYTDVFVSMGKEAEAEPRLKAFLPTYQVNEDLLEHAKPDAIVFHCQPWRLGQEISEGVAYSPRCVAFDQAENRLHTAKGILTFFL